MRDPSKWNGPLGMSLAGSVYIDCSSDFMISNCVQELRKRIFDIDSKGGIGEKKFKDGTYTGALNAQGQRHGRGRMKYRNKSTYEGMFIKTSARIGMVLFFTQMVSSLSDASRRIKGSPPGL